MKNSNLKNIVVLKNLPSNIVEEAFVILKSNKEARKLEKIEKNKKVQTSNIPKENKDYVLKEAEMIIANYLMKIENKKDNESKKTKINQKYNRLKKYAYISSGIILLQTVMLMTR